MQPAHPAQFAPAPSAASAAPHRLRPQARRARILALVLSVAAVGFSLGFGVYVRRTIALFDASDPERYARPLVLALVFLLVALLLRMAAAICELFWLERTWTNLPESLRKIGPIDRVSSGLVVGLSFVPGISWVWKLGLVMAVSNGFERMRHTIPYRAPVPRNLGMAAVIVAWVPGLNVYVAPFLWEMFATRIDGVCGELLAATTAMPAEGDVRPSRLPSSPP
jgi:hypothetical protein